MSSGRSGASIGSEKNANQAMVAMREHRRAAEPRDGGAAERHRDQRADGDGEQRHAERRRG